MEVTRKVEQPGCDLTYCVSGNGPPVVLIQGAGVQGGGWAPQIAALSSRYSCLYFDNRGIGLSQPNSSRISVEQMAADTLALMDAEGWKSAHIVGHSLGGLIALHIALTHRERVRSLALLCTFADGRIPVRFSARMIWIGLRARIGTRRQRRNAFVGMVMPKAVLAMSDRTELAQSVGRIFGHDLADQSLAVMSQLAAMRAYDATPRLGELSGLHTLVIAGSEDLIAPAWAGRRLAQGIGGARFIEIPNAAHALPIHSPALVNDLLLEHLDATT